MLIKLIKRFFSKPAKLGRCSNCTLFKVSGKDLIFISRIDRNGMGVTIMDEYNINHLNNDVFELHSLSITFGTYIACGFNSYVVKMRNDDF